MSRKLQVSIVVTAFLFCFANITYAQETVTGTVKDAATGQAMIGVNILVKGTTIGTATNSEGHYSLDVPSLQDTLRFSFIGYKTQIVPIKGRTTINIALKSQIVGGQQIVVVGFGKQKKEDVVAAITQVSGQDLEKTGDVPNVGMALTGKLPGVITVASTGLPGDEAPKIFIRGRSTWHNASPLILVDGVKRPLNTVDISAVKSISVLKDAAATAVYGVRGANGVILVTTKEGQRGKAQISGSVNTTMKMPSKLPSVMGSYHTLKLRNRAIVHELPISPQSWGFYKNPDVLNKYLNPATPKQAARYPNVDWSNVLFKNVAISNHANLNVQGGGKYITYFANADIRRETDLFNSIIMTGATSRDLPSPGSMYGPI